MNILEIFNELCLILIGYHLFLFTEYVSDPTLKYNIGWSIITVTMLNIIVNIAIMLLSTMMSIIQALLGFKIFRKIRDLFKKKKSN